MRYYLILCFVSVSFTICAADVYGQNDYESPVLDDEEFTQPFQRRIAERNVATQPAPAASPAAQPRQTPSVQPQNPGRDNSAAPASEPADSGKTSKRPWWKFWEKKGTDREPESAPSPSASPQSSEPRTPSTVPQNVPPAAAQPAVTYQNNPTGGSSANSPVTSTPQTQAPVASGTEMKPTAQADLPTPQYDWSQSRMDSMRAGNLPGQQPFLAYGGAKIWAKVGNAVILESDVEAGVKKRIAKMQREAKKNGAPPLTENDLQREIQQWQVQVLQELIQHHIMFSKACASIPKENLESVKSAIDKAFDEKQIPVLIKEYGVASQWELEQALNAEGSSIEKEKRRFFEQSVGIQWLQMQAEPVKEIRHDQIMEYYNKHIDQYTIKPKSRWEELVVYKDRFPSREEAYKAMQRMGQAVVAGQPFEEVAKKYSQGVTASDGGKRDWVSPGALNSEPLNKAIFEQPVGELSPRIIEDENCFYIVRVLERHGKRIIPFEEAQTEIRKILISEQEEENRKKAFEKVFSDANVWTIFSNTPMEENMEDNK